MSELTVKSEVTGSVWRVMTAVGSRIEEDTIMILVESMKMEIPITSPDAGEVVAILVKEGDPISEGDPVVTIRLF
jgi:acetyl-CoA carboxylase biotin carboxyl carrier protein